MTWYPFYISFMISAPVESARKLLVVAMMLRVALVPFSPKVEDENDQGPLHTFLESLLADIPDARIDRSLTRWWGCCGDLSLEQNSKMSASDPSRVTLYFDESILQYDERAIFTANLPAGLLSDDSIIDDAYELFERNTRQLRVMSLEDDDIDAYYNCVIETGFFRAQASESGHITSLSVDFNDENFELNFNPEDKVEDLDDVEKMGRFVRKTVLPKAPIVAYWNSIYEWSEIYSRIVRINGYKFVDEEVPAPVPQKLGDRFVITR